MARTPGVEIRELTPERLDDQLHFFDLVAFADNPHWAKCFCAFFLCRDDDEFDPRTKDENRAMRADVVGSGRAYGLLAYRLGRVVGWCHAAPKAALPRLNAARPADPDVGSIVCFIVAPDSRRQGVATALLDAAVAYLRGLGLRAAEAYPPVKGPDDPALWPAVNYHGPLSMFEKAGFRVVREAGGYATVRREL